MAESYTYTAGNWIAHSHFGIGQIIDVEVKSISGDETSYYRIKTAESTFWVPVDQMDSELIRPLATPEDIQQVIVVLQNSPKAMSSNTKLRQSRIHNVRVNNTPSDIARLLRDLRARQRDKGLLYSSERSAYRTLKQQLVQEWAIVTGTETEEIGLQIDGMLDKNRTIVATEKSPNSP